MAIIYGNRKKGIKAGGTLDSAGNISVGGKDPTSPTGLSGVRNQATGYNPSKDPNYRAPSGRNGKKNPEISEIKGPSKSSVANIAPTTYTNSLSAGAIKNLAAQGIQVNTTDGVQYGSSAPRSSGGAATARAVTSALGLGIGTTNLSNGPYGFSPARITTPPVLNPYTGLPGSNAVLGSRSSIPADNTSASTLSKVGQAAAEWFNRPVTTYDWTQPRFQNGSMNLPTADMPAGRLGFEMAATIAPPARLFGSWGPRLWNGLTSAARSALVKLGIRDAAQLESVVNLRRGAPTATRTPGVPTNRATQFADNAVYAGTRSTGSIVDTVIDIVRRGTIPVGGITTAETMSALEATPTPTPNPVQPNVVRNAVPAGAAPTSTDTASMSRTAQSSPTATTAFAPTSFSSMSDSSPSGVSGSYAGASPTGITGATGASALRGEYMTEEQAAAQARAMELQRQSAAAAGLGVPPLGEQVDVANLQALRDKAKSLLDQYGTEATTMPEFKSAVQQMLAAGIANINKIQPTPPEPVVDTPEQANWLSQFEETERVDDMAQLDQWRRDLGVTDLERQKIDVQKQLNAVNEVYQKVIDDIKANPNLPKGLAARRLTEIFEDQKFAASSLIAQLDLIDEQLKTSNAKINQNLGILETQVNQEEKQKQRRMDQLGLMIDSGAIGGMSDNELSQWSEVTGVPTSALKNMRTRALEVEKNYKTEYFTDDAGNVTAITKDMNDPLAEDIIESFGQIGRVTNFGNAGGGTSAAPEDVDTWANLLMSDPDNVKISNVPDKIRTQVVRRYNELLNAPPSDAELQAIFEDDMNQNKTFEQVLEEIDSNPLIVNKAQAGHIAAGVYNVTEDTQSQTGAVVGFFSRLFGK